ncbi:eukaryotic translation initiation factor 4E-binding protein 1 [Fimicolochytrium jonesii]|uniref:eukaryotic translation initiation factor 4E-binding protein 1 n=1 Tax=Fimicolochytrium jonesii TaxID=1396493 RepID=UPI0022FE1663|nr:eukaryotic translation initiation factor 4E-binding protein 1 [Fimicolochytrium jonesii]KAI8815658.1 eukaryotic translation initiation factor 4E-binding protein 1 [Fimicolochytrium jonesii]
MTSGNGYLSPPTPSVPMPVRHAGPGEKPPHDYGTTPGGTIFGTTPGGTRIIYTKDALMNLSRSPLSQKSPRGLAYIPGITKVALPKAAGSTEQQKPVKAADTKPAPPKAQKDEKDDLFDMEI